MEKIFYPEWWLKVVDYNTEAPVNPYWNNPDVIEFATNPVGSGTGSTTGILVMVMFTSLVSLFIGYIAGKSSTKAGSGTNKYHVVPRDHQMMAEMTYSTSYQAVA